TARGWMVPRSAPALSRSPTPARRLPSAPPSCACPGSCGRPREGLALARLIAVDGGLHSGFGLGASGGVLGCSVAVAPLAQLIAGALKVGTPVAGHQLVAPFGVAPSGPVVRKEQDPAKAPVGALPQALEMANARVRRADAGEPRAHEILGRIPTHLGRNDGEGRNFREIALVILKAEFDVLARLLGGLSDVREGDDAPIAPIGRLAVGSGRLLINAPVARVGLERIVGCSADREHAK